MKRPTRSDRFIADEDIAEIFDFQEELETIAERATYCKEISIRVYNEEGKVIYEISERYDL